MSSQKPFEIIRWDGGKVPTPDFLVRMMEREGLVPMTESYQSKTRTPEQTFSQPVALMVVLGEVQYSFPGYGVVELFPGDRLDLQADVIHDIITTGAEVQVLRAFK